jgi:hypothetical protein
MLVVRVLHSPANELAGFEKVARRSRRHVSMERLSLGSSQSRDSPSCHRTEFEVAGEPSHKVDRRTSRVWPTSECVQGASTDENAVHHLLIFPKTEGICFFGFGIGWGYFPEHALEDC